MAVDGLSFLAVYVPVICYTLVFLARVCDVYFVPSINMICSGLGLKGDIAGATLMAVAVSTPDLFINGVSTFLTEGDIGLGTVFGSGVVNLLLVPSLGFVFSGRDSVLLDPRPVTRDSVFYGLSVLLLALVLRDNVVRREETLFMIFFYFFYVLILALGRTSSSSGGDPLLPKREVLLNPDEDVSDWSRLWTPEGCTCWWLLSRPADLVLYLTVPRPRLRRKLYVLSFFCCLGWLALASYVVAASLTSVGVLLGVPDSLLGLTLLAVGTSVPTLASGIIVTRQGKGDMAFANALGSNTFDILLCLGLPWFLKTFNGHPLEVSSRALPYSSFVLLSTLAVLYVSLLTTDFFITKKLSIVCVLLYCVFVVLAVLLEMNVFFPSQAL